MKVQLVGFEKKYGDTGYRLFCIYQTEGVTGYKVLSYRTSEKFGVCFPSVKSIDGLKVGEEYEVKLNEKNRFTGLEKV